MKFVPGNRYFSDDGYEFFVENRSERSNTIRGYIGLGLPANFKIRIGFAGRETITVKGHVFEAR